MESIPHVREVKSHCWLPCSLSRPLTSESVPLMWRKWRRHGLGMGRERESGVSLLSRQDLSLQSGASSGVGRGNQPGLGDGMVAPWERLRDRAECPAGKDARRRAAPMQGPSMLQRGHEVFQTPLPGSQLLAGPKLGWELRGGEVGEQVWRDAMPDLLGGLIDVCRCAHMWICTCLSTGARMETSA